MDPLQIASWSLFPTLFIFLLQQNFHIFVRFNIQTMTNHVSEMMVALLLPFMLDEICTGIAIVHWKMQQLLPRGFHFTLNLLNFAFHMQLIVKLLCMYIWRNRKIGQSHSILKSLEDILLYIYFQFVYFDAKANVVLYRWYYYYLPQYLHHEVVQRRP